MFISFLSFQCPGPYFFTRANESVSEFAFMFVLLSLPIYPFINPQF